MADRRTPLRTLAALGLALGSLELVCFLASRVLTERFTWFEPGRFALETSTLSEDVLASFHPTLGWKKRHDTPHGERPRRTTYAVPFLATFGDSYTYCAEVPPWDTWQEALAGRVHADVYNFGNSAYGTDQALLRFREDYPAVSTELVALGLITENVNRVVNRYRPFYYPQTGVPFTKPRFLLEDGELRLLENPVRSVAELGRLADPAFLGSVGEHDLWFNRNDYPRRAFPYCRFLFNRSFWTEARRGKLGAAIGDVEPRPWTNLWADEEARTLMFALFDTFFAEAEALGGRPLLVLLPTRVEVAAIVAEGRARERVETLRRYARERGRLFFDGVAALASSVASTAELDALFATHLTPRGNRLLAEHLHEFLAERGLLP